MIRLLFLSLLLLAQCRRLEVGKPAPPFVAQCVPTGEVSLDKFKGQKVLLSFMRNVGCPVCNLHTQQLRTYADSLRTIGVQVLMVHQSSRANIAQYIEQDERAWSFLFISDSTRTLYDLYRVKPSFWRFAGSIFHGALRKRREGKKLFKNQPKQEGKRGMLGADILIDERGNLMHVHYARFVGDHLPPAEIYRRFSEKR